MTPLTAPPQDIVDLFVKSKPAKRKFKIEPGIELDTEDAIRRQREWLGDYADTAVQGDGGAPTTIKVANCIMDDAISPEICFELMRDHWNDRCSPPWDGAAQDGPDSLYGLVMRAEESRKRPIGWRGRLLAEETFEAASAGTKGASPAWPTPTPYSGRELSDVPPRQWIVPGMLARTFVTAFISPGGMGKTQFMVNLCLAIASGRRAPLDCPITEKTRVWYWNQEDDGDELDRRIGAARKHYGISRQDLHDAGGLPSLFIDSGVGQPLTLSARAAGGRMADSKYVESIVAFVRSKDIGVVIFDPLAEFHEANENDNPEMKIVMAALRRIAVEGRCAVAVAAHSRKPPQAASDGFVGEMDSMRGASSQGPVVRLAFTLYNMSAKDAKAWDVSESERHLYVRVDSAKANLFLRDGKPQWLKRVSVPGANDETIGVLEPASLGRKASVDLLHLIAKGVAHSLERGAWHTLAEIMDDMSAEEKAAFGAEKHRFRQMNAAMEACGLSTTVKDVQSTETEFGILEIVRRKGKGGAKYLLRKLNSPTLQPEISEGELSDAIDMFS